MKDLVSEVLKLHAKLKASRQNWDSHWEEVAKYVIPKKDDIYTRNAGRTTGEKKTNHAQLYDSTAIHSNELLASALHSMLTNPTTLWFGLTTGEEELDKNDEVKFFLQKSTEKIHQVLNNSNFQTEIHEVFLDLCSFGTASMRIEEDDELMMRFHSRPIYELYIKENSKGVIDTVSREYNMSGRQILQEFGEKVFDPHELEQIKKDPLKEWEIIHLVRPSKEIENRKNRRKKFTSVHVLKDLQLELKLSGFYEFPYVVPRWSKISGETYGRSPAMKSLPDIKMINEIMKATIRSAQKLVDPPLQVPDDGVLMPLRTSPGAINYYRAGTKDRIEPLRTEGRPDLGFQLIDQIKVQIRQSFFIDQLQLNEGPQMTATEVMQRTEEKLRLLGPLLGRLHFELLQPMIERIFGIMIRRGHINEENVPEQLDGKVLEVKFSSAIARSQKTTEVENLNRALGAVGMIAQFDPTVLDNFNTDGIAGFIADRFGLPVEVMKTDQQKQEMREQRQQQQEQAMAQEQQMQEAEMMQKAAPMLKE